MRVPAGAKSGSTTRVDDEAVERLRRCREDVALARRQRDDALAHLALLAERTGNLLAASTAMNLGSTWSSTRAALDRARTFLVSVRGR